MEVQWHSSVLVAPVVYQSAPIMQINTGLTLEYHWAIAVWFQCSLSSGFPVYCERLVWRSSGQVYSQHATPYVYNCNGESCFISWFHLYCNPKYKKNYNGAHIQGMHRVVLFTDHFCSESHAGQCLLLSSVEAVERTVELYVSWGALTPMWRYCNAVHKYIWVRRIATNGTYGPRKYFVRGLS